MNEEELLSGWNNRIADLKENGTACLEHLEDLAADAELTRLRAIVARVEDVDGMAEMLQMRCDRSLRLGMEITSSQNISQRFRDYAMEGK